MTDHLTIKTTDEASDLLRTYSAEDIRLLWERGAFGDSPQAVKTYLKARILAGDLEKEEPAP